MNIPSSSLAEFLCPNVERSDAIAFSRSLSQINNHVAKIAVAFLLTAISGCAVGPPAIPISDPDERLQFNGFSVLPPKGPGWNWVGREGQDRETFLNTTFIKKDGDSTYVAYVALGKIEGRDVSDPGQLLAFVRNTEKFREGPRQRNLKLTFKIDNPFGQPCVRYSLVGEDPKVPGSPGVVFDIDAYGLVCPHPTATGFTAWIDYSRRSPKGVPHAGGIDEGERLLQSVQFMDVRR